ncbi:TrkH family potassium uptake protein [Actinophytocola sp.]|uniref:TrkH family potassium uptake protein n=1 Tax=Actinophytocola sp. TaxID=1872138 RepID=UPI002D7F5153|nr:potassium transporter TrkG [Actinophytocola sp.]HET9139040.1 potassium transporter TrkG [Actinophytocola sp.]
MAAGMAGRPRSPVVRAAGAVGRSLFHSRHPARSVVLGFALAVLVGTILLMLPVAAESGRATAPLTALFTATSAVCVTGLALVDTAGYWSGFGEVVILGLIQIGGLGIMTLATLLGLLVARQLGLRIRLSAQAETRAVGLGELRRVVYGVIVLSLAVEAVIAAALTVRFATGYDLPWDRAAYEGVFHAVSAFNNAGFALYADNLVRFATDPAIVLPVMLAWILGGLGYPVLFEIGRRLRGRRRRWSLHARLTLATYFGLVGVGVVAVTAIEWANPATLGPLGVGDKLLVGGFHGVTPRTAGFNTLDVAQLRPASLLVNDVLMFIGGGSAGTAGGIKVTTFVLLAFVILAELRGEPTVHALGRRITGDVVRQAVTVALLGVGAVIAGTLVLLLTTAHRLDAVLFEAVSAFGTVGLSTGITAGLPAVAQLVLVVLMFVGRLGPITLGSALALRERARRFERPKERPIIG